MSHIPPAPHNLRGALDLSSLVHKASPDVDAEARQAGSALELPGLFFDATQANIEDFLQLSTRVPVVVAVVAEWSEPAQNMLAVLDRAVATRAGQLVLVRIDSDAEPQLAQAFQAQSVPTTAAIVAGRPVQLFSGTLAAEQVDELFDQLLSLAAQNGVRETVTVVGPDGEVVDSPHVTSYSPEPVEKPLPPHHEEAHAALERGDYAAAIAEYKTAIAQDPGDSLAVAALAQVGLLSRLAGTSDAEIRHAAAENPEDCDASLLVADLDISGGHVADALDRLLGLFPRADAQGREAIRTRLLDYFEIVGRDDPRVISARSRLTSLLF